MAAVNDLLHLFDTLHVEHLGVRAHLRRGKDAKLLSDLLRERSAADIEALMRAFFASRDPFVWRAGFTVGVFVSQLGRLLLQSPARARIASDVYDLCDRAGLAKRQMSEWFRDASLAFTATGWLLIVPDPFAREWIGTRYFSQLCAAVAPTPLAIVAPAVDPRVSAQDSTPRLPL